MIGNNVKMVLEAIAAAAVSSGRDPSEITLVAVTKTRTPAEIDLALRAGILHIGENRVNEAEEKFPLLALEAVHHLVGPLQSNKAARAAALFHWIDSLHSEKIADILSRRAAELGTTLEALVQVNISGEETKSGVPPEEAQALVHRAGRLPGLRIRGLMTIGSFGVSPETTRLEFRRMRGIFDRIRAGTDLEVPFDTLSMGMSGDYRIAVEEGSTMLRIGSAIFGER